MNLSTYISKLNSKYTNARQQYVDLFDAYEEIEKEQEELHRKQKEYTKQGFDKRMLALDKKLEETRHKLEAIPEEFRRNAESIREEVKNTFSKKYGVNAASVDANAVTLLNSGVLTDDEIIDLANQYSNNPTMMKIIAGTLKKSDNIRTQSLGDVILGKSRNAPHLEIYDSFAYICKNGLRVTERDRGISCLPGEGRSMSDGIHDSIYPETLESTMKKAAEITTD